MVDFIGLMLEIFVKFLKLFLLKYNLLLEGILNKILKILEVIFVFDKEIWVYEYIIEYLVKKCFILKYIFFRCVFLSDWFFLIRGDYVFDY